nr:ThiF family adenylyltransferase [Borrelia maritima]
MGNFMSYSFYNLGLGSIIFIDEDKIEESNLTKQFLFSDNNIGSNKVDIIEEKIKSLSKIIREYFY